ncbi:beta-lactamase family protein [Flavobacterium sp. NRK F10]|uniref:serine hydrolase domain-containing protein n=1 Tax=Flavobacterium sp. NRK F10 TaxID=2954931 RepID=UPI002090C28B|nr:serine hydrolase domain-containing protein [Flavobacterium sp. NRK F10]MCO6173461.1 beta-lactamase family protein [Flavobacterium sp. NRK F10]
MFKFNLIYLSFFSLLILNSCKEKTKQKTQIASQDQDQQLQKHGDFDITFLPLEKSFKDSITPQIQQFLNDNIIDDDFSGSILIAKNGKTLYESYQGYTDYQKKIKVSATTPIHLASISKVLTAAVILRMVDKNQLQLDQSLQSIFPEFPYKEITIRTLLNHRSGLRRYSYFTDEETVWDKKNVLTNQDILNLLCTGNIPLEATPDKRFAYCNTNYALLALVIEKISGLPYKKAMQKLLFEPLDMKNTFVFDYFTQKDSTPPSYKSTWEAIPNDYLDAVYGDKNIYSTPQDLLKFDKATYSNRFFSDSLRKEIFRGYSYEKKGEKNYGLGIRLREWDDAPTFYYHNGWWHGNTTSYITLKNDTVTCIALANKYTKKVYQIKRLSSLFDNYPFELED